MDLPRSPRRFRVREWLHGPPMRLPASIDRLHDAWVGAPPRLRALVIAALVVSGVAVAGRGAVRSPWGPPVAALVAATDLPAGHELTAADVTIEQWPRDLVPADAPIDPQAIDGRPLRTGLTAGGIVTDAHLGDAGIAHELAPHEVAFPLVPPEGVALTPGHRVDVVAGGADGAGSRLASDARVLAVDAAVVWLALARDEAPAVAGASAWGEVTVVLLPP